MAIPAETIDRIRLSTDIVELVREYVPTLKKSGRNWKACCPFHHEKTPSFMVSSEKGIFHCFGCNAGGDAFKFLMMIDNISWPQAVKKLGDRAGIIVEETKEETLKKSEKQKIYDLLEQAANFYHRCLKDSKDGQRASRYLQERKVDEDSKKKFLVGFAPKDALIKSAEKRGISKENLVAAGLITKTERGNYFEYMSERLVFPIFDSQGRVVAFGGRTLKDDNPKYLNTPETSVYSKSNQLYGLYQALPSLRKTSEIFILEGYMDVLISHQFGVANSAATLGTSLTTQHSHIIKRYCDNVILLFDSDRAGNEASRRAIDTLIDTEISINVVSLPEGVDPDEYLIKNGNEKFKEFVVKEKKTFIEFLVNDAIIKYGTGTPEKKVKAVNEILPYIAKVKNSVMRSELIKFISEKLFIKEDAVISELRRFGKKNVFTQPGKTAITVSKNVTKVRGAEEEIIQLILAHPEYLIKVENSIFQEPKTRKVFEELKNNVTASEIIEKLSENEKIWFRELLLEEKEYSVPEQTIVNLVKDIKLRRLEEERKALEKEIILMRGGKITEDSGKIKLYKDLTTKLKGSRNKNEQD